MERIKSWKIITKIGDKIVNGWKKLAAKHNLRLNVWYSFYKKF